MEKIGLVLEGGGMRGAYSAGVLYWLLENEMYFDYVVGISSGALYAGMYVLDKKDALKGAAIDVAADSRNVGLKPILHERTVVGYEFLYKEVTENLDYPLELIDQIPGEIEIGVYDIEGEETVWKNKHDIARCPKYIQAACTLPVAGRRVHLEGKDYMDGGITTMIPVSRSIEYGCTKHMIITTKSKDYVRKPQGFFMRLLLNTVYRKYPKLIQDFENRVNVYYDERKQIDELVAAGDAVYMYPSKELGVSRYSGTKEQFTELFEIAQADCEARRDEIEKLYHSVKG
ncbi:patatin family protein [Erysipelothrix sp. HDW6A]|uniref:patatin-like phospholipase family protein n=1 Tax=Erysipelothrix sp. HDW6A TaxID=2714928 RepID=UPI00140D8D2B|nr:patatin family protein [Erysipelothrix sp. HDW6A]QIK57115.1 patatin family protein [Erysipelothrix sp. HDW6A]